MFKMVGKEEIAIGGSLEPVVTMVASSNATTIS
jgi:hypothetical protein